MGEGWRVPSLRWSQFEGKGLWGSTWKAGYSPPLLGGHRNQGRMKREGTAWTAALPGPALLSYVRVKASHRGVFLKSCSVATQRARLKPQEKRSWRKISRVRGERSNCQTRLHSSRSRELWTWDHTAEQPSTAVPRPHPTPAPAHLFFLPLLLPGKVRNHSEQAGGGEATRGRETEKGHPLRHPCHL